MCGPQLFEERSGSPVRVMTLVGISPFDVRAASMGCTLNEISKEICKKKLTRISLSWVSHPPLCDWLSIQRRWIG